MRNSSPTVRVARWSATHPGRAISLWLALVTAALVTMSFVPTQQADDADLGVGESDRASRMIQDAGLDAPDTETLLVTARSGTIDDDAATRAAEGMRRIAERTAGVAGTGAPIWSAQHDALLVPVELTDAADDATIEGLHSLTVDAQETYSGLRVEQVGGASIDDGIMDRVGEDLGRAEKISLPLTLVILLVAFGALIAAGIPVLLAFTSVLATLGLYAPLSYLVPDYGTVANVVLLIGMAVGVDYSLFYLKREREERRRGHQTLAAIEIAAETSGRAVVVSGFAVIVAMSGLYLTRDGTFAALATGSILVVAVSVLGSLTVLPALLAKLGHWVDRPRVPLLWRVNRRIGAGGISGRLVGPVVRHPKGAAVAASAVLVGLALPALGMTLHAANLDTLPQDIPAVAAAKRLEASFPAQRPTVLVAVRAPAEDASEVRTALRTVSEQMRARGLATVEGAQPVTASGDGATHLLTMFAAHPEGDPDNDTAVTVLRDTIVPRAADGVGAGTWEVGGNVAASLDYGNAQSAALPWVVGFVLTLTLVMMGWMFRSVTIAAITTVLNLLSVGAAFGVMTLVFQRSWAERLLGFESPGFLIDWVPLFCFVILIGLSMDYHVFVLSRIREGRRKGLSHLAAVQAGITETASVVTSAAVVMVSVFGVFATLSMIEMKQMGVGLALAILLDATLVRLVLLPALLLIFERRLGALGRGTADVATEPRRPVAEPAAVS